MNRFGIIVFVVFVVFVILVVSICITRIGRESDDKFENAIRIMYRQSARWAAASIQDDAAIIKVLHANYAAGYLWAIKDVVSSEDFKRITGEDFLKLESKIVEIQDTATKSLVEKCKNLIYVDEPVLYRAMYLRA